MALEDNITVEVAGKSFSSLERAFEFITKSISASVDKGAQKVSRELLKALNEVAGKMQELHGSAWSPGRGPSDRLRKRSRGAGPAIKKTIKVRLASKIDNIEGRIGAPFPISVHEKGATIRPTKSTFLTIPLPAALDSRGVPLKIRARDWENTFIAPGRSGRFLLIYQRRMGRIVPLYKLAKEVKLPPRLRLEEHLLKELKHFEQRMLDIMEREILASLETR